MRRACYAALFERVRVHLLRPKEREREHQSKSERMLVTWNTHSEKKVYFSTKYNAYKTCNIRA